MPCDYVRNAQQTEAARKAEVKEALARLERSLKSGQVDIKISPTGAVAFGSWNDRDGVTDVCAYRKLTARNSWALRQAIAKAEARTGRKVNPRVVASGLHSHDNGKTWSTHG